MRFWLRPLHALAAARMLLGPAAAERVAVDQSSTREAAALKWRVVEEEASSAPRCGWARVACVEVGEGGREVDVASCEQAPYLPSYVDFRRLHALRSNCSTALGQLCLATVNHPAEDGLEAATRKADDVAAACGGAEIVVFAFQEMYNSAGALLMKFIRDYNMPGYEVAGRCGGQISPEVVVYAHHSVKDRIFPGACTSLRSKKKAGVVEGIKDAFRSNTKGTAILPLYTTEGTIVAASTHGNRGGPWKPSRATMVEEAGRIIAEHEPTFVAWGGDFNMRTPMTESLIADLVRLGITHPSQEALGEHAVDRHGASAAAFDPGAVFEKLRLQPDLLGDHRTFEQVLDDAGRGLLGEIPGLRDAACPTYPKAPGPGKWKTKMFSSVKKWKPKFACQSPTSSEIEYYYSPLESKEKYRWTAKRSRAPSWSDRLVVTTADAQNCRYLPKIVQPTDHDVVAAVCELPWKDPSRR